MGSLEERLQKLEKDSVAIKNRTLGLLQSKQVLKDWTHFHSQQHNENDAADGRANRKRDARITRLEDILVNQVCNKVCPEAKSTDKKKIEVSKDKPMSRFKSLRVGYWVLDLDKL